MPAFAGAGVGNDDQPEEYGKVGRLVPCHDCGRKFAEDRIDKHRKNCQKVFGEKRKAFDMAEQRKATDASGKGLEDDPYNKFKRKAKPEPPKKKDDGKIPKWKL